MRIFKCTNCNRFIGTTDSLYPDWEIESHWLKRHGNWKDEKGDVFRLEGEEKCIT